MQSLCPSFHSLFRKKELFTVNLRKETLEKDPKSHDKKKLYSDPTTQYMTTWSVEAYVFYTQAKPSSMESLYFLGVEKD